MYRAEDREEALSLLHGFEAAHPAFSLPGVLVRDFSSVAFVLPGSMARRWKYFSAGRRITS
jgi:hypothetical protein